MFLLSDGVGCEQVSGGMLLGGPNPGWAMSARSDGECEDEDDSPSATSAIDKLLEAAARGSATDHAMSGAAAAAAAGVSTPAQCARRFHRLHAVHFD